MHHGILSATHSIPHPTLSFGKVSNALVLLAPGSPWNAASMAVKGDLIADLTEDLAAEQKARVTYDNILRLSDDPDVNDVIKFLRAREIVHFQRFGEGLRLAKEKMDQKNLYFVNPSFDQ